MALRPRVVRIGTVDATLLPAEQAGSDGRLVVAVHGQFSHQRDADILTLAEAARARGHDVLTFDLPGHGDRPGVHADARPRVAAAELQEIWGWAAERYAERRVFATSLGAWLTLATAAGEGLAGAWFLSPVVDLAALVTRRLAAAGITTAELRERGVIETPTDRFDRGEYEWLTARPLGDWRVPTHVLVGDADEIVPRSDLDAFCARTGATATVSAGSAHWFHTPSDLDRLRAWLEATLPRDAADRS